jgi:hypothetical protein
VFAIILRKLANLQPYAPRPLFPETDPKRNTEKKCDETVPVEKVQKGADYYADAGS